MNSDPTQLQQPVMVMVTLRSWVCLSSFLFEEVKNPYNTLVTISLVELRD
ncbi:hypothetical protein BDQ12DRAFT_686721 [Crucibulum laeve]|uniref:Uncharacterized protein n=1 Tax=Crucibulum laeve TaxID=68775 RepID=A0A5C3LW66_9AGAR|nr:hypothetical protein BDQ12DRAFT_686721 [Crucibulum laeve]